jgi:hypothetical protein
MRRVAVASDNAQPKTGNFFFLFGQREKGSRGFGKEDY